MAVDADLTKVKPKLTITRGLTTTVVKAVLVDEELTVSWTVKTYPSQLAHGIAEAIAGAEAALKEARC